MPLKYQISPIHIPKSFQISNIAKPGPGSAQAWRRQPGTIRDPFAAAVAAATDKSKRPGVPVENWQKSERLSSRIHPPILFRGKGFMNHDFYRNF